MNARLSAEINALIHHLEDRPWDRRILAQLMGVTDRKCRRTIEEARRSGHLVIWRDGEYALARSAEEYANWERHEVNSRLGSFFAQRKAMRETVARRWPHQMTLGEVA